jgi:hypothetical protein
VDDVDDVDDLDDLDDDAIREFSRYGARERETMTIWIGSHAQRSPSKITE